MDDKWMILHWKVEAVAEVLPGITGMQWCQPGAMVAGYGVLWWGTAVANSVLM